MHAGEGGGVLPGLPPAIRPGLHCGGTIVFVPQPINESFPRPSGRGSIAAALGFCVLLLLRLPSPGHQAGAPLRRGMKAELSSAAVAASPGHQAGAPLRPARSLHPYDTRPLLPPAIRPGLHCGAADGAMLDRVHVLPPAIRPGLHCGLPQWTPPWNRSSPSPGHQAGAPLRQPGCLGTPADPVRYLPPAIRPGLHCGSFAPDAWRRAATTSPGHQAGAPLRRGWPLRWARARCEASPGHQAGAPLRPDENRFIKTVMDASPGHQAGAPLRPGAVRSGIQQAAYFPRPSGRGSIAAPPMRRRRSATPRLPPAIRPGLHCGASQSGNTAAPTALPPAIRPGLHCGAELSGHLMCNVTSSPGHQAGAPLRPCRGRCRAAGRSQPSPGHQAGAPLRHRGAGPHVDHRCGPSPGHQAGAPLRRSCLVVLGSGRSVGFPRPSGRGSIAALRLDGGVSVAH